MVATFTTFGLRVIPRLFTLAAQEREQKCLPETDFLISLGDLSKLILQQ
jgi:hypothetical protein